MANEENQLSYAMQNDDPIEMNIVEAVVKLRQQNVRLKDYVAKSGVWAEMKRVEEWKPFDVYHYFCLLYRRKYKREHVGTGNLFRAYSKIEAFARVNGISNAQYKDFIDTAFARYFNDYKLPAVAYLYSAKFYQKVTGIHVVDVCQFGLDARMVDEDQAFSDQPTDYEDLDKRMGGEAF